MNRIFKYAIFGETWLFEKRKRLKPFSGLWSKKGVNISITVWAFDAADAKEWCDHHGLKLAGSIERIK